MKSTDDIGLFTALIAASAASDHVATVPATQSTAGDGTASIALGFPPETFIARSAGGKPPRGQDMNGFLNRLSKAVQALQAGYFGQFNSALSASIGGYPSGSIVSGSTAGTFWVSTSDNNTSVPGADGATWQSLFTGLLTPATADARYVRGVWNAATDQRILSIARNKTDSGIYVQLDDNTSQRLQLFGDYATNPALNALALTVVTKNASQGPGINNLGIVSRSGQPYCVDAAGVLRYLVKSPGATSTDIPIQSVGINNQRIYVSYDNDTQAAWLVRSPAEGSIDTRVGSVGIANGRPYFGYGGSNDATSALWLATEDFARGSFSFQAAGYQIFPSGLILQWDTVTVPASTDPANNYATFNFPTSFPRGCFGVVGVDFGGDCNPIGANPINNGQAQIRSFKRLTNAASNVTIVHYLAWGF